MPKAGGQSHSVLAGTGAARGGGSAHRGVFGPALEPPAAPWEGEELPPPPAEPEGRIVKKTRRWGGEIGPAAGGVGIRDGSAMPWAACTPLVCI